MEYSRVLGATLFSGDVRVDAEHPLTAPDQQTAELVLTPASPLTDRTLAQANFDWHYQLIPLAVHRPGEEEALSQTTPLRDVRLGVGDVLLVQGPAEQIEALKTAQRNAGARCDEQRAADREGAAGAGHHGRHRRDRVVAHRAGRHRRDLRRVGDGRDRMFEVASRHARAGFVDDPADGGESGVEPCPGDDGRRRVHRASRLPCWRSHCRPWRC